MEWHGVTLYNTNLHGLPGSGWAGPGLTSHRKACTLPVILSEWSQNSMEKLSYN